MDKYWALGKVWHKTKGAGIWRKFVHQNFQIGVDCSNFILHVLDQFPPNLDNFLIIAFTIAVFPLMFLIVGMHSNIKVKKINKRAFSTFFSHLHACARPNALNLTIGWGEGMQKDKHNFVNLGQVWKISVKR